MPRIVLDPGHGGRDPGAVGQRLKEKDVNLKVCLYLRDALVRAGIQVLMTRDKDTERVPGVTSTVDLKARAMLANTNSADLYVSWHYDASADENVHGVSVWIHPSQKDKSAYHKADLLCHHISAATGQKHRGVYLGDFQVLRDTMMDALLVEGGFITNSLEEARMDDDRFLQQQAEAAAEALCKIFDYRYIAPTANASTALRREPLVTVKVNGASLVQHGRLIEGKTYVPVRELAELLGCAINWDNETHTVSLTRGE
ncbi:N-acetylmuramoyl-L-alanine amidase [Tumebacillus sp. BK434]|uniref:N-acetylmuramoyl-L-alanine amidase n=1 Tax=Tumebacillus sp. BK434 TaxID=2512169 RepID=UPI0010DEFBCE|nr:N-acetylmuramoyl-L-alanine amidase [Tumebacillus sp. BK434]TCP53806.1 N-acetylmuramoyl-L-alanine amidase [Tumebacillus sp. BK434]